MPFVYDGVEKNFTHVKTTRSNLMAWSILLKINNSAKLEAYLFPFPFWFSDVHLLSDIA